MRQGFTLSELLISLAILGVIAGFTLPKVLLSQQTDKWNAAAKEAVLMIDGAYKAYQMNNAVSASFKAPDLTPYMNYVKVQTTGLIDNMEGFTSLACDSTAPCLQLHNGGTLQTAQWSLSGTSSTHAVYFNFDPDGKYSGNTTGPGKSVFFLLYYEGRTTSREFLNNPTCVGGGFCPLSVWGDPDWFAWD